jgi:hypothetical protein
MTYIEKLKLKSRHAFAWKAPPTYKGAKREEVPSKGAWHKEEE